MYAQNIQNQLRWVRLTNDHDDEVEHLLDQSVLLDQVLRSRSKTSAGSREQSSQNRVRTSSEPTLLASLYLFLTSAELKMWNSSNRLRTIIRKWFGSIIDAPACSRIRVEGVRTKVGGIRTTVGEVSVGGIPAK